MILETARMVSEWLADPLGGVNALLASTPRDPGDAEPADLATVTDETNDSDVARGDLPANLPAVAVSIDSIQDLDGQVMTITADGHVKVRIRVAVENPTTADAVRDLSYYLRTVQRSFRRFMALDANDPARTRNGIYLESCLSMQLAIVWTKDQVGGSTVAGYLFPILQLRDLAP